jgi:hypothetical protein
MFFFDQMLLLIDLGLNPLNLDSNLGPEVFWHIRTTTGPWFGSGD